MVRRKKFDYHSTSPAEIITCSLDNGQLIHLFCKYAGNHTQFSNGHRGGVEYETKVYQKVLNRLSLSSPRFYGAYKEKNKSCLVIQYLKGSKLLKDDHDPNHFASAAAWIGNLHRIYASNPPSYIKIYDKAYYSIWLDSVEKIAHALHSKYPWLTGVCEWFKENMHSLLSSPQTFIHGEYYTKNILVRRGNIYPIDWESAAIGAGEIDLASLIEGWDYKRQRTAVKKYISARWPEGNFCEQEFRQRLLMAKIYFFLRWTGEYDDPDCWRDRTNWFKNFYGEIKKAGYRQVVTA
ncbi:phosphotransferase family protein [Terrimonas alba]|uniref:phosphotransferase family protein n=1 Tax=Terrimonas alba TaxID=3349636 RepID=UPI0035F37D3B